MMQGSHGDAGCLFGLTRLRSRGRNRLPVIPALPYTQVSQPDPPNAGSAPMSNAARTCSMILPCVLLVVPAVGQAQTSKPLTPDDVRALQQKYQEESAAAQTSGLTKTFTPYDLQRAEQLAKKGDSALAAGRLMEAREDFRKARWQLPVLPAEFPANVSRVFGDLRLRHPHNVWAVAYSPDGSRLASASQDGTVKIWDLGNGKELLTFHGHSESVNTVAFSPDGQTLASAGGDKDIKLWEAATGKELRTLSGHTDFIKSVAFSPDGKTLASGGADRQVKTWEVATGKPGHNLVGHTAMVYGG